MGAGRGFRKAALRRHRLEGEAKASTWLRLSGCRGCPRTEAARGYGPLADQLRRALLGTYRQLTEAAAREGNDRRQRFRCARAECNEAAAAVEGALALGLVTEAEATAVLIDLDRVAAMLTRRTGSPPSDTYDRLRVIETCSRPLDALSKIVASALISAAWHSMASLRYS